ncbi:MAG: hypothetical protein ACJ8GW_12285 [Massilia sp.]
MNNTITRRQRAMLGFAALLLALSAQAQESTDQNVPPATARKQAEEIANGTPARWEQPDTTVEARLRTIRKETAAALQENLGVCRAKPANERSSCVRDARAIYTQEMAGARTRAMSGN